MNLRALFPALLATLAIGGCSDPYAAAPSSPPTAPPPAQEFSREQINAQDRAGRDQREREQQAMATRPLLDHLPLTLGEVEISIYGLADDNRHTVLQIAAPDLQTGRVTYRAALRAHADTGTAYEPRYVTR